MSRHWPRIMVTILALVPTSLTRLSLLRRILATTSPVAVVAKTMALDAKNRVAAGLVFGEMFEAIASLVTFPESSQDI